MDNTSTTCKEKVITAYKVSVEDPKAFPWRIRIDGKKDPMNRDFQDPNDIKEWFAVMQINGYYTNYSLDI